MHSHLRHADTAPASFAKYPRSVHGATLQHLRTPGEIARILHLREEIDLSVHAGTDFESLEKKGMPAASSAASSSTVS